jgi:uncharacterized membrane protein YbaN (DUF454 family)
MNKIKKIFLIILGSVSLFLGIIGIFLPMLPTTPLVLLSAACYVRSSKKLYQMLINNKYLGTYIKNYEEERAIPKKAKIIALVFLWISIVTCIIFAIERLFARIILFIIVAIVSSYILKLKTLDRSLKENKEE